MTGQTTALAKPTPQESLIAAVQRGLTEQRPRLEAYLAKMHGDEDRFRMTVLQAVTTTPSLMTCSASSIVVAALEAAQLGLEPTGILGGAYMVPYENRKKRTREAKLLVGYRGYIDLLRRAADVLSIEARMVYANDDFAYRFGTGQYLRHVPWHSPEVEKVEAGERAAVYWIARLATGIEQFDVLTIAEIEKARKSSKAADRGPWAEWYDEMAKKTAIRRAVKTLPISVWEARRAVQLEDEAEAGATASRRHTKVEATGSARDRAVAALESRTGEDAAGEDEQGGEAAPDSSATNDAGEQKGADSGRPDASGTIDGQPADSEAGLPD